MLLPSPFSQEFLDDLPYDPSVLFLDRIEAIDREASRLVCRMPTDRPMPFTEAQRPSYPRHVAGAVMVQVTGMLGFAHFYYVEGKRHGDGWVGCGATIEHAAFRKLVPPGTPLICSVTQLRARRSEKRIYSRYKFEFHHEGELAFESQQSAMWLRNVGAWSTPPPPLQVP